MKPLSLAALLISINLSFVNANPFEDEHRSLLSGGEAAAEVSVVEKYTCKSIIAIGKIRDSGGKEGVETTDNTDVSNKQGRRSLRKGEEKNSAHRNKEDKPHEPDEDFVCELEDGSVMTIEATDEQLREMRSALRDGNLVSQISTMDVDIMAQPPEEQLHAMIGGEAIIAGVNGDEKKAAKLPPGSIKLRTKKRRLAEHAQRQLGTLFRTNRMLVILVNDVDDRKPPFGADETSDKIFGTYGDPENPSVQLSGCSNNQTSLTPDSGDPAINALMDAPGVVEVDIAISIRPFDGATIENAAIEAANEKLGIRLPGMFDFVAIVIEDCLDSNECGFAAYAYLNSWKSLYVKDYYTYPAIITHELGHNVNLGHSGLARTYDDWSCSMGNPLWADHLDKMCFNPAKNWQIAHHGAWYVEHKLLLDPKTTPVSSHRLVGVSEYGLIESSYPTALAVMKLETHTSTDFFVGFNRANRQNADNRLASNEVTLITAGNNGEGYSESTFIAGLKQGESYAITDFGGSNEDLTVTVNKIDTSSSPGYADVSIVFGDGSSTPAPTPSCSGKWLKVAVDTDNYPSETSWEVLDKCDNDAVVMSVVEGQYTKAGERYEKDECVADSRYEFIIHDEFGDGVCCSWGSGAYIVEYGNKVVVSGGEFGVYDKITFGSCINSPPTAQPTNKPTTSSPTKAPATSEPTAAPTNVPTKAPTTSSPTKAPETAEPTAAPTTNAPTKVPATPPPSAKPTSEPSAAPTTHAPTKAPVTPLPTALPTAMPTSKPTPTDVGDDSGAGTFKEYTTPNIGEANDKAKGVIFTITAKSRDVIITALGIVGVGKDAKNSDVQVYSHSGSYEAFPDDRRERGKKGRGRGRGRGRGKRSSRLFRSSVAAWDEYFEDKVMLNPQEIVNVELDEEITIPAGGTVSVYVLSKKGVSYKASDSNEFDGYAESDDFVLKVGTATKKEFKQTEKLADFAGRIVYETGIAA